MSSTPRLEIYPDRIESNARTVIKNCHDRGAQAACVTKVTCAHPAVVKALVNAGADMIGDSRIQNLRAVASMNTGLPLMLLRIPTQSQALDVVRFADISLNSSLETMKLLSEAAVLLKKNHKVILMVDVGDLREGIWPDRILHVLREVAVLPGIEILGLGCNLACYGGVIPSHDNMRKLIDIRDACRRESGLELNTLSGGNSSSLPMLGSGEIPLEINHFRIGEGILLGRNVLDRSRLPETRQDTFRMVAEVVEIERKPSVPIGKRAQNAFGESVEFVDRGIRRRAILNLGRQDVVVDGIEPEDDRIIVLGGSSDHTIVDVEEARSDVKPGDELAFYPGYGALLALSTSPYVEKVVIPGL